MAMRRLEKRVAMLKKRVEALENQQKNQNYVEERTKELESIKIKVAELEKNTGLESRFSSKDLEQLRKLLADLTKPLPPVVEFPQTKPQTKKVEKKKKKRQGD